MYFTYIIYSPSAGKYYVGSTQDIDERLRRHNEGHSKSTKGKGSWKLVETFSFETRSEAMRLERKIKKRGIQRFLEISIIKKRVLLEAGRPSRLSVTTPTWKRKACMTKIMQAFFICIQIHVQIFYFPSADR